MCSLCGDIYVSVVDAGVWRAPQWERAKEAATGFECQNGLISKLEAHSVAGFCRTPNKKTKKSATKT